MDPELDSALLDDDALEGKLDDADDCFNEDTFGVNAEFGGWDVHKKTAEFFEMREHMEQLPSADQRLQLTNGHGNGFLFENEKDNSGVGFFDMTQSLSKLLVDGSSEAVGSSATTVGSEGELFELSAPSRGEPLTGQGVPGELRQVTTREEPHDPILRLLERSSQTPPAGSMPNSGSAFQVRELEDLLPTLQLKPGGQQPVNGHFPARNSPDLPVRSQQQPDWRGITEQPIQRHPAPGPVPRQMMPGLPYLPPPGPRGIRPPVPLLPGMPPIPHGPGGLPFPFMMRGMLPGMERFRGPAPPFPLPGPDQRPHLPPGMPFPQGPFRPPLPGQGGLWQGMLPPDRSHQGAGRPNAERPFVLMTDREKEWIQKIQLIQLSTTDAFLDDYYYLKYRERCANHPRAKPPLALPIPPGQENERHDSFHGRLTVFPGALGAYVSTGSVHCPRQTVDVAMPVNYKTALLPIAERRCTLQHRGASLRTIEDGYDLLLSIDDIDHKLEDSSSAERLALLERRKSVLGQLFGMLRVCEYQRRLEPGLPAQADTTALSVLSRLKGAHLVTRLIPLLPSDDQRRDIAALVLYNASSLMHYDGGVQNMSTLLPAFYSLLEVCQLPFLHFLLQLIICQPVLNKRPVVVALLEISSGAAFLALLVNHGQKQCAASPMARISPPPAVNNWSQSCKRMSELLEPHLTSLIELSSSCMEVAHVLTLLDLSTASKPAVRTVTVRAS